MTTTVGIFKNSPTATTPTQGTAHAACSDIYSDLQGSTAQAGVLIYTIRNDIASISFRTAQKIEFVPIAGEIVLRPNDRALIPTGLIFDIPQGYCVKMYPRSGLSVKRGVTLVNSVGVIDSDYVNESYIPIINLSDKIQIIQHGDRLAQIELCKIEPVEYTELSEPPERKSDRDGGFGSTGTK